MHPDQVAGVRRFNRTVTQRIGALDDEYLARQRPLGASRLLWEIGDGGSDVRTLRARLGLDSGYVSRLLRGLETDGLVTIAPDPGDGRVRVVQLTKRGRAERAALDAGSAALAWSLLEPLDGRRRAELLAAMATVERLLTAGAVVVTVDEPTAPDSVTCLDAYFAELRERFDEGFDPLLSTLPDAAELTDPKGLLMIARLHGEPIGCGALKLQGKGPADVKRMWVSPAVRGIGVGKRILAELEAQAAQRGIGVVRLETNNALGEAIQMYRSAGYLEVAPFNDELYAHHWFEKQL
jgi:DNA-binding MarR family transcriptional regulator